MNQEDILIPQKGDRLFCVKCGKVKRENLYEMARKYWKARLEKASQATHVLAIQEGKGKAEVFANAIKHDFRSKNPTTRWSDIIKLK